VNIKDKEGVNNLISQRASVAGSDLGYASDPCQIICLLTTCSTFYLHVPDLYNTLINYNNSFD